jgi:hypothetical protein
VRAVITGRWEFKEDSMGVATQVKIPQEICSGGKRQTWGYVTVNTQVAAITIKTGLNSVQSIELQPYKSSGLSATECVVASTLPTTTGSVNIFTEANNTYIYWLATGI